MLTRAADGNELVVFRDIDAFHTGGHTKDLRFEGQPKVVFQHRVKPGRLFRFAVCVHQCFFEEFIKPRLAQVKFLRQCVLLFSLSAHDVFSLLSLAAQVSMPIRVYGCAAAGGPGAGVSCSIT